MRPPFPGMDPWLESPGIWPGFHNWLIAAIADELSPKLAPRYFVALESRTTVLTGRDLDLFYRPDVAIQATQSRARDREGNLAVLELPEVQTFTVSVADDEEVEERFIRILELPSRKLVTVIEVLSPTNKKTAETRAEYITKRQALIRSRVNFVEIDLLRGGQPMPLEHSPPGFDYRILVCRAPGLMGLLFPFVFRSPIPPISIPLLAGDPEPMLDLNSVVHALIERARYHLIVDYFQPPDPPLRPADEAWAAAIVAGTIEARRRESSSEEVTP